MYIERVWQFLSPSHLKTMKPIGISLLLLLVASCLGETNSYEYWSNYTLRSEDGDLSVVLYLPYGVQQDGDIFYRSTRFDHSSMIGTITRKSRDPDGIMRNHVLYGAHQWRPPHDPWWPESGIGLASEFGVGDDGDFCNWRCGWYEVSDVNNGILGYQQAQPGQSFLKIGVGELIKGSCNSCDSTEIYNFNSPYKFAKTPQWNFAKSDFKRGVALEHEAFLDEHGYKLRKDVSLEGSTLKIKHTLTNLGRVPFATAWYSHHFFTCDSLPVDRGYVADLNLPSNGGRYSEPGTWSWSKPIDEYARVKSYGNGVEVKMERPVEADTRIKAEFQRDDRSDGGFSISGCGTTIEESILDVNEPGSVKMYAYNFYIESGTFSPEPQYYMHLYPGETTTWTQQLVFRDTDPYIDSPPALEALSMPNVSESTHYPKATFFVFITLSTSITLFIHWTWRRSHADYTSIPDL